MFFIIPAYLCMCVWGITHLWLFYVCEAWRFLHCGCFPPLFTTLFFFKVIFLVILLLALLSHCFLSTLRYTQIDNRQTDRQVTDSAYERKCDIYLPESVLFYLPRRSLVSIIFQKMIQFLSLWLSKVHFCVLSHFNLFIYFLALSLGLYCHCCE